MLLTVAVALWPRVTMSGPTLKAPAGCVQAEEDFQNAASSAGLFRLRDLENTVSRSCGGASAVATRVKKQLQDIASSLRDGGTCRHAQATIDNAWYRNAKRAASDAPLSIDLQLALKQLLATCTPAVVEDAKRRWPGVFAAARAAAKSEEQDASAAQAQRKSKVTADAADAERRKGVDVAKLVEALDKNDDKQLDLLLRPQDRGPWLVLSNGEQPERAAIVGACNLVLSYRRERVKCRASKVVDAECLQRLLAEGAWREQLREVSGSERYISRDGRHPVFTSFSTDISTGTKHPSSGLTYPAFDAEVGEDLVIVDALERRQTAFRKLHASETQRREALMNEAHAAAGREPKVVLAGVSDSLCSLYSQLEEASKAEALQSRIDRASGTVDVRARRQIATMRVLVEDQIRAEKAQYLKVGGTSGTTSKSSKVFWCGQPKRAQVLETTRAARFSKLLSVRTPPSQLCARAEWKELAAAASSHDVFQTCTFESVSGTKAPISEPSWTWMLEAKRTGEEFRFSVGDEYVEHFVFQYKSGKWSLLRIESCSWPGGVDCGALSNWAVAPIASKIVEPW